MPNEKLMILKMLEEGKISAKEAGRLLEAAGSEDSGASYHAPPRPSAPSGGLSTGGPIYGGGPPYGGGPSTSRPPYRSQPPGGTAYGPPSSGPAYGSPPSGGPAYGGPPTGGPTYGGPSYASNDSGRPPSGPAPSRPSVGYDSFASDLSRRFDAFARDLEPKLQRLSETVVGKTADIADRISKSLDESMRAPSAPPPSAPPQARSDGQEKRYELFVTPGYNELNIAGLNGDALIHGYNGDKISATVFCKPKRVNAALSLMRLGNKYFLNYDSDDFEKVAIDAYVPESMFNVVSINTVNGILDVSTLSADNMSLNNLNGQTKLQSLSADYLNAECNNGKLNVSMIKAKNARVENFNGAVDALDLDCANLRLTSVNGGIIVNMSRFMAFPDYVWDIESSNGKMTLNLPTYPDLGYYVKARASLGQIRVGLTNLNYIYNSASLTEAKSINFDGCPKKVKLALETSNATLQIN